MAVRWVIDSFLLCGPDEYSTCTPARSVTDRESADETSSREFVACVTSVALVWFCRASIWSVQSDSISSSSAINVGVADGRRDAVLTSGGVRIHHVSCVRLPLHGSVVLKDMTMITEYFLRLTDP